MPLHLRSADRAPARLDEWYGRTPESVVRDPELSLGAKAMFGAITLAMAHDANRTVCLTPMAHLGQLLGVEIRQARRLVAELEARGHVTRERVRTIAGSPQGIRPTAGFRKARNPAPADIYTRSDPTDCNRSSLTARPVIPDRAPGQIRPGTRSSPTATLKRGRERDPEKVAGSVGVPQEGARPTPATTEAAESPEELAETIAQLRARLHPRGAKKSPGGLSAKNPPRGQEQASEPDAKDGTAQVPQKSRPENQNEHKPG